MFLAKYIKFANRITKADNKNNSSNQGSGYSKQVLEDVDIICYDIKIYVPQNLKMCVLDWYHFHQNNPGGSIFVKTTRELCYWKGLVMQAELHAKPYKIGQKFKNIMTIYGLLPPKNITELKPWDTVHVNPMGLYSKSKRQHHLVGDIIKNDFSVRCITMIDIATDWF